MTEIVNPGRDEMQTKVSISYKKFPASLGTGVALVVDHKVIDRVENVLHQLQKRLGFLLRALQVYGMILADNGSNFYFQGEANSGWTEDDIEPLKDVPASAFEVVQMGQLMP